MADRRMFARSVISSARFLRLPATSRLLYYDLGMEADDDGCVEAFAVLRKTGASEDDLRVLQAKGFVTVLDEDLVTYITAWTTNNKIRRDRYHPGPHINLLRTAVPELSPPASPSPADCQPDENQVPAQCQSDDNQTTPEVRLGKVSLGKSSLGKSSSDQDKEGEGSKGTPAAPQQPLISDKKEYGIYGKVLLTESQYSKLQKAWPLLWDKALEALSAELARGGYYEDHYIELVKRLTESVLKGGNMF